MSKKDEFTNRHGRRVSVFEEDAGRLPELEYKTSATAPIKRRRRSTYFKTATKYIVLSIIIIGVVAPVLLGEYARGIYLSEIKVAKQQMSKLFNDTSNQRDEKVTSSMLRNAKTRISSIESKLCPGGFWDNIAKLYPRSLQAYNECATYRGRVALFEVKLGVAIDQMVYLEKIQATIQIVARPVEDRFAVLTAQQENWQEFNKNLEQLSAPESFAKAHSSLKEQASDIHSLWVKLIQASNSYNSTSFAETEKDLTVKFSTFGDRADMYSVAVSDAQTQIHEIVSLLE